MSIEDGQARETQEAELLGTHMTYLAVINPDKIRAVEDESVTSPDISTVH